MLELGGWIEEILRQFSADAVTNAIVLALLAIFVIALLAAGAGVLRGLVHYTPNLLTSLGILGTFVGIVIGLLSFDVSDIDGSIGPLLEGLKTAFITSLSGMALAILFKTIDSSGLLRRRERGQAPGGVGPEEIHRELAAQREAMERLGRAVAGDEDATLISQIRLLRSDGQEQSRAAMEQLKQQTERQVAMSSALDQHKERLAAFEARLWQELDQFAEMLSKSATETVINALKEVIADFNRNLTEQFGENFKELNAAVEKLVQWQENYKGQLQDMHRQYEQGVQAITTTQDAVSHISEESKQIPVAMGELKTLLETTQHQLDELERHLEAFKDMRDRAVEAVPQIRQQMDGMVEEVTAATKDAGARILAGTEAANAVMTKGAEDFSQKIGASVDGMVTEVTTATKDAGARILAGTEAANEAMAKGAEDFSQKIGASVDGMVKEVTAATQDAGARILAGTEAANEAMAKGAEDFSQKIGASVDGMVKDVSTAVRDAGEQIASGSQNANQAIIQGAEDFKNNVNRTNEGLVSASDQLANNSEKIREQLESTVSDINENVRNMVAGLVDHAKEMGNTLTESNRNLQTSMKEVEYQVTDSIEKMQKRLESALEEVFQAQTREMSKVFNAVDDEIRKSVGTTGEAVNEQLKAMDTAMQREVERVMNEMGRALATITGQFTSDYTKLVDAMANIVRYGPDAPRAANR